MAVELLFNPSGSGSIEPVVKTPTFVIAKKNGEKLGVIPANNIRFERNLNSANTVDFKVYKSVNGVDYDHWDDIKDLRLMWCKEWDMWFEMHIDITQSDELVKCVNCVSIGEAELSVIKLYGIEINTDNDIARDDYVQTVLYDELKPERSLLHRISEKIPHYTIKHVDNSIANIQRTFTFDDCSIMDAFTVIAEEISCLFILSCSSNASGLPERGIYVYDLMSYCNVCGYRDDYFTTCPECDSTNVRKGFGGDTGIFISDENVAKEITLTTDLDNVFNCFKLRAGDDVITATIANLNPNGSEYVWYFPEYLTNDMSTSLRQKLAQYNIDYNYYQNTYQFNISQSLINRYNSLIQKYSAYNHDLEGIGTLIGFPSSTEALYGIIDFELYLTNALSPDVEMSDTSAYEQASLLTSNSLSPVAITNLENASHATVSGNVLSVAKTIVSPNYKVDIAESTYDSTLHVWQGVFVVTNYSSESDTSRTQSISVTISDDYERYVRQKITNTLKRGNNTDYSVTELFNKQLIVNGSSYSGAFANELKKYSIDLLENFYNMCQSCLDVLIEDGVSNNAVWSQMPSNLYQEFYQDYYQKLQAIEKEISLRESELSLVKSLYNSILDEREYIQSILFIKTYIGESLWKEFCSHRRESTYSNDNYISDGLSNSELIKTSEEFLKKARIELVKSATLQHSISSSLNNLLLMDNGFSSIVNSFEVGNWLRIKIDNKVYRLRLINYSIDYDDLENLNVEFSDVIECGDSISDIKSILQKANYMSTTYQTVERQVDKNDKTTKRVNTWFEDGLDATLTKIINNADSQSMVFDEHGLLMRRYDNISSSYQPEQLKIINSTLAVTDDDWATTKTAVGKFLYFDPVTYELKSAFGVNAEMVIGRMILGQGLGIYNAQNSLKFDENGLTVTNNVNTFKLNPNAEKLLSITRGTENLLSVDTNGNLNVYGNLIAKTLSAGGKTSASSNHDGLFIDSYGNLFAGNDNQVQIYADGTFDFANGGITYDGTDLSITVANLTVTGIDLATGDDISEINVALSELGSSLQGQIDAKIETWAQSTNPASSWGNDELESHNGDLWYYTGTENITVGGVTILPSTTYQYNYTTRKWVKYNSSSTSLFDFADSKATVFYGVYPFSSATNANTNDIAVDSNTQKIYRYNGTSWVEVQNYNDAISDLKDSLIHQVDSKIETWVQSSVPSNSWTSTEKADHDDDLWLYTGTTDMTVGSITVHPQGVYQYNASTNTWTIYSSGSNNIFDMIDGKTTIYYGRYFTGYSGTYYQGTSAPAGAVSSPSTYDMYYNSSTTITYIYLNNAWQTYLHPDGDSYFDTRYGYVYEWKAYSTFSRWNKVSIVSNGDYYYSKNELSIRKYNGSSWVYYYNIENGDYLVDADTGCTYKWSASKWNLVTDYQSAINAEVEKYMRFESAYGLMIANMVNGKQSISSATSYNVLLGSTSLKIRNGTSTLAEYGSSIKLYKPGTSTAAVEISPSLAKFTGSIIADSGTIGGFNITSTSNTGNSSSGGHFATSSLYTHVSSGSYEYEAGLKGSGSSTAAAFYVRRISSGGDWDTGDYIFYVANNGYLYATNANITGTVKATSFTVSGSNIYTTTTIGDDIVLNNTSSYYDASVIFKKNGSTIASYGSSGLNWGDGAITYSNGGFHCNHGVYAPTFVMQENASYYTTVGSTYIGLVRHASNGVYFGIDANNYLSIGTTYLYGGAVRIYSHGSGAVYLGISGNTAITSDETLKDIYAIDDKYIKFFNKLNPVAYTYKVGHRKHIGFGAQSVEKALSDSGLTTEDFAGILVDKNVDIGEDEHMSPDGKTHFDKLYSLRYEEFIALNTMMIQKLQGKINDLERQLAEIKG